MKRKDQGFDNELPEELLEEQKEDIQRRQKKCSRLINGDREIKNTLRPVWEKIQDDYDLAGNVQLTKDPVTLIHSHITRSVVRNIKKKLSLFDFGIINVFSNIETIQDIHKRDYFTLLKGRCESRIKNLEDSGIDIGNYYVDEIRNGMAHGCTSIIEYKDVEAIEDDCIVMKLLCRYGIMKKYQQVKEKT